MITAAATAVGRLIEWQMQHLNGLHSLKLQLTQADDGWPITAVMFFGRGPAAELRLLDHVDGLEIGFSYRITASQSVVTLGRVCMMGQVHLHMLTNVKVAA